MNDNELEAAAKKIREAHQAEDSIMSADSHAIHPDELEPEPADPATEGVPSEDENADPDYS